MKKNIVRFLWNNLWINPGVRDIELTGMCDLISGVQKSTLSLFSACAYSNHCRKKIPEIFRKMPTYGFTNINLLRTKF